MGTRGIYCKICKLSHEVLAQVDNKLRGGTAQTVIAREYGISRDSLGRHYRAGHHVIVPTVAPSALPIEQKGKSPVIYAGPDGLSKSIYQVMGAVEEIFERCKVAGKDRQALEAAKVVKQFHELGAKIEGLIKEGQVNILVSPGWLSLQNDIIGALREFPEARAAVLERLRSHNTQDVEEAEFEITT